MAAKRARYAANPEPYREYSRRYAKENPDKARDYAAARRAGLKRACPYWVDRKAIRAIYAACPDGYHVDHIVPLKGKNVCGLHVPWNLQYLHASENTRKGNRFDANNY